MLPETSQDLPQVLERWNHSYSSEDHTYMEDFQVAEIARLVEGIDQLAVGFRDRIETLMSRMTGGLLTWMQYKKSLREYPHLPNASLSLNGDNPLMRRGNGNFIITSELSDLTKQLDFTSRIVSEDKMFVGLGVKLTKDDHVAQANLEFSRPWRKEDYERFIQMAATCHEDLAVGNIFESIRDDIGRLLVLH